MRRRGPGPHREHLGCLEECQGIARSGVLGRDVTAFRDTGVRCGGGRGGGGAEAHRGDLGSLERSPGVERSRGT